MNIVLYCAVPAPLYNEKTRYGLIRGIYRRLYRTAIVFVSWVTKTARGDSFYLTDFKNSNKGDYAIVKAIELHFEKIFPGQDLEFSQIQWQQLSPRRVDRLNRKADLFVIAGSGYLAFKNSKRLNDWLLRDIGLIQQLSCPVFAYGIGVNLMLPAPVPGTPRSTPLAPDQETRLHLAKLASKITAGTVRDPEAYRLLKSETNRLHVMADPAFLWRMEPLRCSQTMPRLKSVGINFAVHNAKNWESFRDRFSMYLGLFSELQDRLGCRYKYFCHSKEELVVYRMLKASGLAIELIDCHPERLADEYKGIDFHICQMLHSAILCTSVGTPVINFAYNKKSEWFFERLNLPDACQPRDQLTDAEFTDAISEAIARAGDMQLVIATAKQRELDEFAVVKSALSETYDREVSAKTLSSDQ